MATKSETYEVNKFLRLIKEHKATATRINELVEVIRAQQEGRAKLGELRTTLYACTEDFNQYNDYYNSCKDTLASLAVEYFVETHPIEAIKRRKLAQQMHSTAKETRTWEIKKNIAQTKMAELEHKIERIVETLGDCDTSLELALDEYRTAVLHYNTVAEKLSKFKSVNIPLHSDNEVTTAKSFEINAHFGEENNAEVLI